MTPTLAVWANVLRPFADVDPEPLDEVALASAGRLSRRFATAAITDGIGAGLLERAGGGGGRGRHGGVTLTDAGRAAAAAWSARIAGTSKLWQRDPLRTALEELVAQLPFELPHHPASYGAADPSAIGGPAMQREPRKDGLPAHGADWRPVERAGAGVDTASFLPTNALLSQALMAFTIDYEDRFPWPLASTASVLVHLGADPRPLDDLPAGHGLVGNGKSLLERHLIVTVSPDPADRRKKRAALTDRGLAVLQHHPGRLQTVETEWRERYSGELIDRLRNGLEKLGAAAG